MRALDPQGRGARRHDQHHVRDEHEQLRPVTGVARPKATPTPTYAAAGMVVTEIATPTAAPPSRSYASIPATPAAIATSAVPGPSVVSDSPSTESPRAMLSPRRSVARRIKMATQAATALVARPLDQ